MSSISKLGVGRLIARRRSPYLRTALLSLIPVEAPGIGTMAVTRDWVLFYDPVYLEQCSDEEAASALIHELFHPLCEHWKRGEGHPRAKVNVAGDLAINQNLRSMGYMIPTGWLLPAMYGLPNGLGIEGYLARLPDDVRPPQGGGSGEEKEGGQRSPGVGRGQCGSGAGNPIPGEADLPRLAGRTQGEGASIRRRTAEAVRRESSANRGTVPADLARWAEDVLQPPVVPWEQKFAAAVRSAVAHRPGLTESTYRRISRRQAGVGFGVGHPILAAYRSPQPRVGVIVDTSGSMGTAEIARAVSEIDGILREVRSDILCVACDAKTHAAKPVKDWRAAASALTGGGGTDMRPAFRAVDEARPRPEIVVCITDGCVGSGIPDAEPVGMKAIFVLVGPHRRRPCQWGEHVEVDR